MSRGIFILRRPAPLVAQHERGRGEAWPTAWAGTAAYAIPRHALVAAANTGSLAPFSVPSRSASLRARSAEATTFTSLYVWVPTAVPPAELVVGALRREGLVGR